MLRRSLLLVGVLLGELAVAGCDRGPAPLPITLVPPQVMHVGHEISVPLAVLVDEEAVSWSWRSLTNPDLSNRLRRPTLTAYTRGRALWRWTPMADDLGKQKFEWSARTKSAEGSTMLEFVVGTGTEPPVFREPVGEGTTLDLRTDMCAHIAVVIESTSAPRVELRLLDPPPAARLVQTGDLTGDLDFCPSSQEIMDDTVYPLMLEAQAEGHRISKTYVIVLRRP